MIKLLSLIGSLGLTTSTLTPIAALNTVESKQEHILDIGDFRPVTYSLQGTYSGTIEDYISLTKQYYAFTLRTSGYETAIHQYFDVEYILNDFTNEEITVDEAAGDNGAKHEVYTVRIVANELGNIFGYTGKADMVLNLHHAGHDLSNENNLKIFIQNFGSVINMKQAIAQFEVYIEQAYGTKLTDPLCRFRFGAFEYVNYLINDSGEKLTDEELTKISLQPGEEIYLRLKVRATEYGKTKGIVGNAEFLLHFYHPDGE